jgi:hypothetical protein
MDDVRHAEADILTPISANFAGAEVLGAFPVVERSKEYLIKWKFSKRLILDSDLNKGLEKGPLSHFLPKSELAKKLKCSVITPEALSWPNLILEL